MGQKLLYFIRVKPILYKLILFLFSFYYKERDFFCPATALCTNINSKIKAFNQAKGQLISKRPLEKIVWTKIATKKFDHFCPGGQMKKIKALSYMVFNVIKCLYFFDLTTRAEIVKFFRCYFGPNDFFQKVF